MMVYILKNIYSIIKYNIVCTQCELHLLAWHEILRRGQVYITTTKSHKMFQMHYDPSNATRYDAINHIKQDKTQSCYPINSTCNMIS